MNGFSAGLRQATNESFALRRAARLTLANAAAGSSKNITPRRELSGVSRAEPHGVSAVPPHRPACRRRSPRSACTEELLDAAGVSTQRQGSFAEQLLRNEADMPSFWSNLTGGFEPPRIQLALQWGAFTHGHLPLLSWWKAQYDNGQLRTLADACAKTEADWLAILNSGSPAVGAPSDIPGATETERRQSFAKVLARTVATALPMVTYRKRIATSSEPLSIRNFFDVLHPSFDFREHRLSQPAFGASVSAMSSADRRRIQGMERLFRVVPRYEEVKTLIDAGYFSAHQILEKGRGNFVSQMQSALGGTAEAEAAYNQAAYSAAAAKMIFGKYGQAMHVAQVRGLPDHLTNASREASQIPDWKSLFGSAGGCACEHCKSVLGPAAYFVDLLQWLKQYNVFDALLARRPDLTKIKLTCKSSHTPLPYLDLVNEALEVQVANETVSPAPALTTPIETTYEPAELFAGPEILHPQHHLGAWKAAAAAVHPFTLPRDLWAEEAEVYLRWLGTSREELVRTLSLATGDGLERQLSRARLGARDDSADAGWRLLAGTHTATTQAVWGGLADYLTELRRVPRFIAMAGLSGLAELEELLATRYVNKPNGTALATLVISPENGCDIDAMTLPALAQGHLDRIHRFIRLARRTGVSFGELDTLLVAFQDEATHLDLTPARIGKVTAALSLSARLGIEVSEIAALYAPLDTSERYLPRSAYRRLFLDKRVDAPDVADFEALLAAETGTLSYAAHRASLEQALSLRAEDLDLLFDAQALRDRLNLPASERLIDKTQPITRAGVSLLFRLVRLARALGLSVSDFLVLRALSGRDPFSSPAATETFLDMLEDTRAQGLDATSLQYVLRAFAPGVSGLAPADDALGAVRAQVALAIEEIHGQTEEAEDPAGDRAKELLRALVQNPTQEAELVQVLAGRTAPSDVAWRDRLIPLRPYLEEPLSAAQDKLAGPLEASPFIAAPAERFLYVTRVLSRHLRGTRVVVEKLAAWAKLEVRAAHYLLENVLRSQVDASYPATYDFLHPDDQQPGHRDQALLLLRRHALLLQGVRIQGSIPPENPLSSAPDAPGELTVFGLYSVGSPLRTLIPTPDPEDLPAARAHFERTLDVARHTALRDRLAGGPDALRKLLEATGDAATLRALIAEGTGWDALAVEELAGSGHYNLTAEELRSIDNLLVLERGVKLVSRVGLGARQVLAYLTLDPPLPTSLATPNVPLNARDLAVIARRGARANVSAEAWVDLARKLRDEVRNRVRRALLDWLVPRKYKDTTELFARMLLDPEMGDCLVSSRIVAATNSVQLFVQRCFLRLESGGVLGEEASRAWEWMKTYRVWEANRKVFLYPENYIQPELRDDKTPLFKRLETRLRQGEVTAESVERALAEYLDGLHEIARLEVMAVETVEEGYDEESELPYYAEHVVARTRSKPHRWFYRRRVKEQRWTPWEKIELDLDTDSIHLRWWNRRLYLFWPTFVQKPLEDQKGAPQNSDEQAESVERLEMRIAWSVVEGGAFVPARLSTSAPLRIVPAKSDTTTASGITPERVSIVPPTRVSLFTSGLRLLVVVKPSYKGALDSEAHIKAGMFTFDVCGGGRWQTDQYTEDFRSGLPDPDPSTGYLPNTPCEGSLLGSHILEKQSAPGGELRISRELYNMAGLASMKLLTAHTGRYSVVTPARIRPPHFAMDRFSFEDDEHVFYASFRRSIELPWIEGIRAYPGLLADYVPRHGRGAGKGILEAWAEQSVTMFPYELANERYRFELFEHPYVCEFSRRLSAEGVFGLLGWKGDPTASVQFLSKAIDGSYGPTSLVDEFPVLGVDFSPGGAYSQYNWELFFHAPLAIAKTLHREGRYAEAQKWFHLIFDPTTGSPDQGPKRYWKVKPFYENEDLSTLQEDLGNLALTSSTAAEVQAIVSDSAALQRNREQMEMQIALSVADPFSPHALARFRLLSYQKSVVLAYVELLLDWGDSLFFVGSMETLHEALQLYLMAAEILGPRPTFVEHRTEVGGLTYEELSADLDRFSNAAVNVEPVAPKRLPIGWKNAVPKLFDFRLYFCIPANDKLLGLWDRVADRLFKLRNCLDLEGVARQIPLLQPPIDPALLVRARAAGVRFDQVLKALAAPAPMHRFVRLHAKAAEFAGAVLDLGRSLLGAIEKKDGEALALLRQGHDVALAEAEREVRTRAVAEARETLKGLERARRVAEKRLEHYRDIKYTIPEETSQVDLLETQKWLHRAGGDMESLASGLALVPDFDAGASGMSSPVAKARYGGSNLSNAARAVAAKLNSLAADFGAQANLSGITASWKRRQEEWKLQAELAKRELSQFDKQLAAQEIRVAIAEQELWNLELRLQQSREVESFLRSKFTHHDLYDWMVAAVAAEHYQAYQLAFDMAKRAERAYQLERGDDTSFIRFGAWDSLKKGLLAGERLLSDLRAMDAAYLAKSEREREIVKHVALSEIDAEALRLLRDGSATDPEESPHFDVEVQLTEDLFDADYPGHYFRRIKSVAVTVPTVKPTLDSVQCELSLVDSEVRLSSELAGGAYARAPEQDARFRDDVVERRQLATSAGEADSGLFEVNLRDDLLLPFEGAGAISTWKIRVPRGTNRFPLHLISDVILHLRYTAKDGGEVLRKAAYASATSRLRSRTRMFSLRRDFPAAWGLFLQGNTAQRQNEMEILLVQERFLSFFGKPATHMIGVTLSGTFTARALAMGAGSMVPMTLYTPGETSGGIGANLPLAAGEPIAVNHGVDVELKRRDEAAAWRLVAAPPTSEELRGPNGLLAPDVFEDLWLAVTYTP
jgi:hypothetical protein